MKQTIRKIIIAAAVFFAAGLFNISANAQQAEMQVYSPIGMVTVFSNNDGGFINFDASGAVQDIPAQYQTETGWAPGNLFQLLTNGMTIAARLRPAGIPYFEGNINRELQSGDAIRFFDLITNGAMLNITVRIYNKGGTDLFIALGEEMPVLATSVSGDEFFIRTAADGTGGEMTTTPHTLNIGYVAPDCSAANVRPQTDGLACRPTELSDCIGDQTLPVDICVDPTCIGDQTLTAGVCENPTCIGDQTLTSGVCENPTCIGDQTLTAGVCVEPTCIGDQTLTAGVCENPTCIGDQTLTNGVCENPTCIGDQTLTNGVCENPDCPAADETLDMTQGICVQINCIGDQTAANGVCVDPTCIGDQTLTSGVCENPVCTGEQVVKNGVCEDCSATETFAGGMCRDTVATDCENEVFSGGICQTPETFFAANTITVAATYTADSCESAGWISSITINSGKTAAAEVCEIPLMRTDTADDNLAASRSLQPQIADGGMADGCVIRQSPGFSATELPEECGHANVFGEGGFPQMPAGFNVANDRLIVAVNPDGNRYFSGGEEVFVFVPQTGGDSGTSQPRKLAYIGAGVFVVGAAAMFLSGGDFSLFDFAPDFGYSATESGYAAKAGGRLDFHKDNWHLYYSADSDFHRNGSLEFRYTSGGKYTADIWAATFSESVAGETADYNFSLSANFGGGIWNISPIYRLHSEYEKDETETQNTLNLEGILRYNGWTIRPAAGFRWENADDFADNARFQINAIHRF